MKKTFVYILKLNADEVGINKWYVGRTTNIQNRINAHFNGNGAIWCKKYLPIKVEEVIEITDNFQEDTMVKKYMDKYGIDNVRGGSYSELTLNQNKIDLIEREIRNTKDLCFNCGSSEHFVNNCDKNIKKRKNYFHDNNVKKSKISDNTLTCNEPQNNDDKSVFNNFLVIIRNFFSTTNENDKMQIEPIK